MPRHIDADALYESTAEWEAKALAKVKELNSKPPYDMTDEDRIEWRMWTAILGERTAFKHDVADAPTADVVEVVRCKECKWFDNSDKMGTILMTFRCKRVSRLFMEPNAFCSHGERREDGEGN